MTNNPIDIIITKRLLLRGWTSNDAEDLYRYAKNPNVGPHGGWKPHESVEESLDIIENLFLTHYHCWAIEDKESGRVIGSIGFEEDHKRENIHCRELGYALAEEYWGKGLMTEAAKAVLNYGFNNMGLEMISIYHNTANIRSRRVIEKCGFKFEGVLRRSYKIFNGEIRDVVCYSMIKEEYHALYNRM